MREASGELKLRNVGQMTDRQRKRLADWLIRQAWDLRIDGKEYAALFDSQSQTFTVEKRS